MSIKRSSARNVLLILAGVIIGALVIGPVGAHVGHKFGHLWKEHIKPKFAQAGTINKAKNPVDWTRLKNVPAEIADGNDNTGGGGGGGGGPGDISSVTAGTGLTGGGDSGDVSLAIDTSTIQARVAGDCTDPVQIPQPGAPPKSGRAIKAINGDGTVTCDEDTVGLRGVEIVSKSSDINSVYQKYVIAECPPGKIVIGGGGRVHSLDYRVALIQSTPWSNPNGWLADGAEMVPMTTEWSVEARAICAWPN
jgi:hypothetical protein